MFHVSIRTLMNFGGGRSFFLLGEVSPDCIGLGGRGGGESAPGAGDEGKRAWRRAMTPETHVSDHLSYMISTS